MKKIIMLFSLGLLLSGCSAEVTLKIDAENVSEIIKVYDYKENVYTNDVISSSVLVG